MTLDPAGSEGFCLRQKHVCVSGFVVFSWFTDFEIAVDTLPKCGSQRAGALQPGTECPACLSRRPNSAGRTNANANIVEPPPPTQYALVLCPARVRAAFAQRAQIYPCHLYTHLSHTNRLPPEPGVTDVASTLATLKASAGPPNVL